MLESSGGMMTLSKDEIAERNKLWRKKNEETLKIKRKAKYLENRGTILLKAAEYRKTLDKEKVAIYDKEYREKNKERIRAKKKKYRMQNKEKWFNSNKSWRDKNKEYVDTKNKKYYKENRDAILIQKSEYGRTPNGKIAASRHHHKRRAQSKETECTLTLDQWNRIIEIQENKCIICGKKFTKKNPATKDHIIPLSKKGGLTFENTQAVHLPCNCKKRDKLDISNIVTWLSIPIFIGNI